MLKSLTTATLFALALSAGAAQAEGSAAEGFKVFKKCYACHKVKESEGGQVAPNLHGVFGREAGAGDFRRYSDALKQSDVVWTEETMAAYLRDPQGFIPGNKMPFPGLDSDEDIRNVIAYLKRATR